jgi:hypothetical protein
LPSVKSKPSSLTRRGGSTVTLPVIPMNTRANHHTTPHHTRTRTRLHPHTKRKRPSPLPWVSLPNKLYLLCI